MTSECTRAYVSPREARVRGTCAGVRQTARVHRDRLQMCQPAAAVHSRPDPRRHQRASKNDEPDAKIK